MGAYIYVHFAIDTQNERKRQAEMDINTVRTDEKRTKHAANTYGRKIVNMFTNQVLVRALSVRRSKVQNIIHRH